MKKETLKDLKDEILDGVDGISYDFIQDHDINDSEYFCDAFMEYADNNISPYYKDQYDYYMNNDDACDSALLSMYSSGDIAEMIKEEGLYHVICHAGVCGMYEEYTGMLYNDFEKIKKVIVLNYLIDDVDDDVINKLNDVNDIFDDIDNIDNNDRINDLLDVVDSHINA